MFWPEYHRPAISPLFILHGHSTAISNHQYQSRFSSQGSSGVSPFSAVFADTRPVNSLSAAATDVAQLNENAATLSYLSSTLIDCLTSNSCICNTYKKQWGWSGAARFHQLPTGQLFPIGNRLGSAGGESAIASSFGNCCRNGSGTFTFEPFKMLINCSALTTPFP